MYKVSIKEITQTSVFIFNEDKGCSQRIPIKSEKYNFIEKIIENFTTQTWTKETESMGEVMTGTLTMEWNPEKDTLGGVIESKDSTDLSTLIPSAITMQTRAKDNQPSKQKERLIGLLYALKQASENGNRGLIIHNDEFNDLFIQKGYDLVRYGKSWMIKLIEE